MFPPYRSSIKQKVMLVIMLASITVLLVAATAFMIYDPVTVRQTLSHYLASLAQQIAEIPVIQKARSSLSINRGLPQACSFQRSIAQSTQHRQENFVTCGTQFGRTRFSAIAFFLLGCHQCKLQRILTVEVRFAKRRASVRPKRLGRFGGIIGVCAKMPVLATLARQLQFSTRIARVSNRTGRFHTSMPNPMNAASPLQGEMNHAVAISNRRLFRRLFSRWGHTAIRLFVVAIAVSRLFIASGKVKGVVGILSERKRPRYCTAEKGPAPIQTLAAKRNVQGTWRARYKQAI